MKPLPGLELHRPRSLEGALEMLAELEMAKPIAGGTDLIPLIREAACKPKNLVDLTLIEELRYVREEGGSISIGAATTLSQIEGSELIAGKAPALHEAVCLMGSPQIRNRGTLGGNLYNASPAADSAPPLMVLDAEAAIASREERYYMPLSELFAGPKMNSLEPGELLTEVRFRAPPEGSGSSFQRLARRRGFTLSVVNAAAYMEMVGDVCGEARIALGAIAATPIRMPKVEEMLVGEVSTPGLIEEAAEKCRGLVSPIDDVRGSAEYRCDMASVLMARAIRGALERAGRGP